MFTSRTTWQAEDYEVTVTVPGFGSVDAAAKFGNAMGLRLRLVGDQLVLSEPDGRHHVIDDAHASLRRLKDGRDGATIFVRAEDFEPVSLPVAKYCDTPNLNRGFGSLAYGVLDADGAPVSLPS